MRRFRWIVLVSVGVASLWFVASTSAQHEHMAGEAAKLGKVSFSVSCDPKVQSQFTAAVAMLHSFWYDKAAVSFASIAQQDPACGMAYWGMAMTYYHPLWEAPGQAALQNGLAAVEKAKSTGAKTQRELDYISAIEVFYKGY